MFSIIYLWVYYCSHQWIVFYFQYLSFCEKYLWKFYYFSSEWASLECPFIIFICCWKISKLWYLSVISCFSYLIHSTSNSELSLYWAQITEFSLQHELLKIIRFTRLSCTFGSQIEDIQIFDCEDDFFEVETIHTIIYIISISLKLIFHG